MDFSFSDAFNNVLDKVEKWFETLTSMLPNIVVAILVLVLFYFLAKFARSIATKGIARLTKRSALSNLVSTSVYIVIILSGLMIALGILDLDKTVSSILAGAGIIGLALGFAFQDIAANYMSGIIMAVSKPILVDDIIETNGHMGTVEKINLRTTVVRTFQGLHVIIPNREVFQNVVTNYTKTSDRRVDLECGVSYGDDLEKVRDVAEATIKKLPFLLANKGVDLFFTSFGDSSINFSIRFWIEYPNQMAFMKARSESIIAIKKAFDENDISIPYPIRTLDFGIKGGEKLSEMKVLNKD